MRRERGLLVGRELSRGDNKGGKRGRDSEGEGEREEAERRRGRWNKVGGDLGRLGRGYQGGPAVGDNSRRKTHYRRATM